MSICYFSTGPNCVLRPTLTLPKTNPCCRDSQYRTSTLIYWEMHQGYKNLIQKPYISVNWRVDKRICCTLYSSWLPLCSTGVKSYDTDPAQPLVNSVNHSTRGVRGGKECVYVCGGEGVDERRREGKRGQGRWNESSWHSFSVFSIL